ncbi:hypothetical protein [Acinetobacter soli]|uniref:hypothetical protein n=1 Tax=Acinetobacter soli TaxID=487316 RepID=UPI00300C6917
MENSLRSYHDVDVTLPSQQFNVVFSYTTTDTLDFIDSMVLRLLVIAPLPAEKIARFLGLTNHEADVLLTKLLRHTQIQHLEDDRFALTQRLEKAFTDVCSIPYVSKIEDTTQKMGFEMIGLNPEPVNPNASDNGVNSIKLIASNDNLSNGEVLVNKEFQKNFRFYFSQGLVKLGTLVDEKKLQLYKMSQVEKLRDYTRRIALPLTLNYDNVPSEINEFNHMENVNQIEESLYNALRCAKKPTNIKDILKVLNELDMDDTLQIESIFSEDKLNLDRLLKLNHKSNEYFIGPIYSKENSDLLFKTIKQYQHQNKEERQLCWLVPSDEFWGKSDRFVDFIDRLSTSENTKNFKCFLPVAHPNDKQSMGNFKRLVKAKPGTKHFLAFRENSAVFDGNFELMVVKDAFSVLIIHVSDSSTKFLTTVPVGIIIKNKAIAQGFYKFFEALEEDEDNFFGSVNPKQ